MTSTNSRPPASAIAAMGDKIESKKLAKAAGVSVVPGFVGEIADTAHAVEIANGIGFALRNAKNAGNEFAGSAADYLEAALEALDEIPADERAHHFDLGELRTAVLDARCALEVIERQTV